VYCRISDDRAGQGLGVKRQEEDARSYAKSRGWEVVDVYVDNDISAYSGRRRPGYERLLGDLQDGRINAVVAWHPDRLHRSPLELERFIQVVEVTRAKIGTVRAGEYDLSTPSGRMAARIVGAVARGESEHKSDRIRRKHEELAAAGQGRGGGTRPFGFQSDRLTVDPGEAELVREAARRILAGETIRAVCADWTARGVQTVTGSAWTPHVLKRLLISGRIAGLREHRGQIVAKAVWSAIITETEHRQLRAILNDPRRRTNGGVNARSYLLSGFVRCARCRARMVARPRQDGCRRYVCAKGPGFVGCGGAFIIAKPLEDLVVSMVLEALRSPEFARAQDAAVPSVSSDELAGSAAAIEAKLTELAEDWAEDRISRSEWLAARRAIEARLADATRSLARTPSPSARLGDDPEALQDQWKKLHLDGKRAVLAEVVDHVVVGPGRRGLNRFDESRVKVVWLV
jgi:site-specific DNA recombinase